MDLQTRYQAWVVTQDAAASGAEEPSLSTGDFHYFSVPTSRGRRLEAVVSPTTVVTRSGAGDWATWLTSAAPDTIGKRIAWLHGTAALILPGSPSVTSAEKVNPGLSAAVAAPAVVVDGAVTRFTGWFVYQPGSQVSRLDVEATAAGAKLVWTPFKP